MHEAFDICIHENIKTMVVTQYLVDIIIIINSKIYIVKLLWAGKCLLMECR